jgi:TolA-binding protein
MTDPQGQSTSGHAPIDPGTGVRGSDGPGAVDARSVKVDMGQGTPPFRGQPERPATAGGAGILISSVLALLIGGAGAWAYERFLAQPTGERPTSASPSQGRDSEIRKDLAGLDDRIKDLSDRSSKLAEQYKQLQARVESIPASAPIPNLAPIEQKVAVVDRLTQQVEAIGKKVDPLPGKLEQEERRIAELDEKLNDLRNQEATASRTPGGRDRPVNPTGGNLPSPSTNGEHPASGEGDKSQASGSGAKSELTDSALDSGVSLFNEKKYGEAYARFRRLLQAQPDDARVWYYAALSYGLSTGDWGRMTQSMVEEGVARENAGKPAKAEIDSALSGLTKESGKDWLDFYRRRAR